MAGQHKMRALGRNSGGDGAADTPFPGTEADGEMLDLADSWVEEEPGTVPFAVRFGWLAPVAALLAVAAWTGIFAWANFAAMQAGTTPAQWVDWFGTWAIPVGLIGIMWLLAMRSSRAEAHRFAATASLMNRESVALEARLKIVNRELSLAREFLAAQARDLEALGRIAADRLSSHAGELQGLITTNGAQVETIATTSEIALGNMDRLRDHLPVIANAARDVANQIGSAGRAAEEQLDRLAGGFDRLGAAGTASEAQVSRLSTQVEATLGGYETTLTRIDALVAERFAALQADAEAYRERLDALEAGAMAALAERSRAIVSDAETIAARLRDESESAQTRFTAAISALHDTLIEKLRLVEELDRNGTATASQRLTQLRDEAIRLDDRLAARNRSFDELIEQRQAAFETWEAQASEVLSQRLAALDDALAQRREAQIAEIEKLVVQGEAMSARVAELTRVVREAGQTGETTRAILDKALEGLSHQLAEKRSALAATEAQLAQLTDSGVRLLEIVQSGARSCREDLTGAINSASSALGLVEERADTVSTLMLSSTQAGSDLSDYLLRTRADIDAAEVAMSEFRSRLGEATDDSLARLQGLRGGFARLAAESGALTGETQEALRDALGALETAITQTFATLDNVTREKLRTLAGGLGTEAVEVLERTLRNETAATLGKIEQSAAHASGVGREAAVQLRDQLVKVNELTGNLEQRINRARELAEEQVNNDFTRRMALITDSLNSAAIDISGALSGEIADTAWDAYLKGDRGIFTRRAVRLIDNGTAKEIAALYSSDEGFKANVSRYVHDFEALLRQTLSTRHGHVLSVTMLGSDMGKLYVALAQSIQRFRT
ncbi:MAG: ATPase [Sphingomonadales bacterium]|nr:MAG: ATPase [Sphingomonadales bacterium]